MDPLFLALSNYQRRKYEKVVEICSEILEKNAFDKAAWLLKMKALTEQVYVDEIEANEEGVSENMINDSHVAQKPRFGTGIGTSTATSISPAVRPVSQSGRPLSGFLRLDTSSGRPGTMNQKLKQPRTSSTSRPITSSSGRHVRLGTSSMLSNPSGPFINLSHMNYSKYATKPSLAKALFEYIFYHENDIIISLELARLSSDNVQGKDWWWLVQVGKCYARLGMLREAESQYKSALNIQTNLDTFLLLGKIYIRLDQPLQAIEVFEEGLKSFPNDVHILISIARTYDQINLTTNSANYYKTVVEFDGVNTESISSIASNYFYTDQPEIGIRLYRRLLQMGIFNVEIFNNLALCCFYAQHYDMTLKCFECALNIGNDEELSDVWYNISHVAFGVGDNLLAYQCLRLAITMNNQHVEAYNNLAVLELRQGDIERAKLLLNVACELSPYIYETHYNQAAFCESIGDLQSSYKFVQKSINIFPGHCDSKFLLEKLASNFSLIS